MPDWLHLRLISEQAPLDDEDFANLGVWICPFSNLIFRLRKRQRGTYMKIY